MNFIIITALVFFVQTNSANAKVIKQGAVIAKCEYGEGESEVTITIHKEFSVGSRKTADITHGSDFKRSAIVIESIPGLTTETETGFAGRNNAGDKTITNISYGKDMSGSMNYNDNGVVFHTPALKCKEI